MEDKPLVSVITPVYNAENFISETIRSVIAQTYRNWEMILIDDKSTDASFSILKKFAEEEVRIRVFHFEKNQGAGNARNEAVKMANGDFIAFLDSDDSWTVNKLEVQVQFMLKNHVLVSFSSYRLMDESGVMQPEIIEALPVLSFKKLTKSNYIGNLTGMYNVRELGKIYAPTIRKRQDWALWLKIVKRTGEAHGIQQVLAYYRVRKGSISGNKFEMLRYNYGIYKNEMGFSRFKSLWRMIVFLKEHFFVKQKQVKRLK